MKKFIIVFITVFYVALLTACMPGTETDYVAAIMVNGEIYYKTVTAIPAEIDESAILGYTDSYTDTFPKKDGETNFNSKLGMPYARVEEGIVVLFDNEWYLCRPQDSKESKGTIKFYSEPTEEGTEPVVIIAIELTNKQESKIKNILAEVKEWYDDYAVNRVGAYYYNGEIMLPDSEFIYYFMDEYNIIYYDHYYAEISHEYMEYIKSLAGDVYEEKVNSHY